MKELDPQKLNVTFGKGVSANELSIPRRYTLTHSDLTGDLFLTIGSDYNKKQISGFYTRLMRDEVLAEWIPGEATPSLHVYCHVSGGIVLGSAGWRSEIFHHHMRQVLEALRYSERELVSAIPGIQQSMVMVHFISNQKRFNCVEEWGIFQDYE